MPRFARHVNDHYEFAGPPWMEVQSMRALVLLANDHDFQPDLLMLLAPELDDGLSDEEFEAIVNDAPLPLPVSAPEAQEFADGLQEALAAPHVGWSSATDWRYRRHGPERGHYVPGSEDRGRLQDFIDWLRRGPIEVVDDEQPAVTHVLGCPRCGAADQLATLERLAGLCYVEKASATCGERELEFGELRCDWDSSTTVGMWCAACGWERLDVGNDRAVDHLTVVPAANPEHVRVAESRIRQTVQMSGLCEETAPRS